jgi:methyl-accepting chemotaxis protein
MTAERLVGRYSTTLAVGGTVVLFAALVADPRWVAQPLAIVGLAALAAALRAVPVALGKYSYLHQTGVVGLVGALAGGLPATALALAGGVATADWLVGRKTGRATWVNLGREVIALTGAYGVYAWVLYRSGIAEPRLGMALIPAAFALVLAYFLIGRILFYFTLMIRDKLTIEEQRFVLRYECIGYAGTVLASSIIVAALVAWPPLGWLVVAIVVGSLGVLFRLIVEEAIAAELLSRVHALAGVVAGTVDLSDACRRIEQLAWRIVDWGDLRVYRRHDGEATLAYRSTFGRPGREAPAVHAGPLRQKVLATGALLSIDDAPRDRRVPDPPAGVRSLVIVPLKVGDRVIGTLELEHHKRRSYRKQEILTISTFAGQLATAMHISHLRGPLVDTVGRVTRQLGTLTRTAGALRALSDAVVAATAAIRAGVGREEDAVSGGLRATASLSQLARRVSADGAEAAQASSAASEVAARNRQRIRDAIDRLVALKGFVGESSGKVQQLGAVSRRITGFIASIRELADMTNLLALNAAIEAARAGRHGTGFAVVAEEVRRLAEQSASAAAEAADLVQDVHRQVGEVVEQMRRGEVNVGGVEELSSGALAALDQIVTATAEATAHARRIAGAAGEQDEAFTQLRERIGAVAQIAERNRGEAGEVASRAQQAADGVGELERATRELEQVAAMLGDLTREFAGPRAAP